jgi:HSP20 family protein
MAITRWRGGHEWGPFRALRELEEEMSRIFGLSGTPGRESEGTLLAHAWSPSIDVYEKNGQIVVKADAPGLSKDDFTVSIEDNRLTIEGEKKKETEVKDEDYHRVERLHGTFQRSFELPATVAADKIEATYKDGVLEITMPKKPEAKPKRLTVKVK